MRAARHVLLPLAVASAARPAAANGRFPATVNVHFQPGSGETVLVPSTFGLLISHDGGDTFRWTCEVNIGYSGVYDPAYAVSAAGFIYATSFDGLRVSRDDGCTFETIGPPLTSEKFTYDVEVGPDGRVWAATATGGQANDVYVASGDDEEFVSAGLLADATWWMSLETAPTDANRIYVSGYIPETVDAEPVALLRRSVNGGESWEVLPVDDFDFGFADPMIRLLGASPVDEDILVAAAVAVNPVQGDALYRSADGGQSWTKVFDFADVIGAFTFRADGQTVIAGAAYPCPGDPDGAQKGCVRISDAAGAPDTWRAPESEPLLACVGERADGTLIGCAFNFEPDNFAVGTSADGETWESTWRFAEFADASASGPLECPADNVHATECVAKAWPSLACDIFMLDLPICGAGDADGGAMAGDAGIQPDGGGGGCCRVGDDQSAPPPVVAVLMGLWLLLVWGRRRRGR